MKSEQNIDLDVHGARVTHNLDRDLLELKEIQRSLPRAQQLPDPVSGRVPSQFLQQVPIGLLPLLPDSSASPSPTVTPPPTPTYDFNAPQPQWNIPPPRPRVVPPPPPSTAWVPPHLQHLLPKSPPPERAKAKFAFLPLLETPPSSASPSPHSSLPASRSPSPKLTPIEHPHSHDESDTDHSLDPPTPALTNASLDSSPLSRASSISPEPSFLSLADPDAHRGRYGYGNGYARNMDPTRDDFHVARNASRSVSPRRPFDIDTRSTTTAWHAFPTHHHHEHNKHRAPSISPQRSDVSSSSLSSLSLYNEPTTLLEKPKKRRNVMIVNGIEIPLDDDDEEEEEEGSGSTTPNPRCSPPRPAHSHPQLQPPCKPPIMPIPIPLLPIPIPTPTPTTTPTSPKLRPSSPHHPKLSCSPSSPGRCARPGLSPIKGRLGGGIASP
ncbi:hypothetical protein H0H93_004317 [Arthromyces matolae]|nr:hypothetical protein H0H93_004317 [Arthromyces matolae]